MADATLPFELAAESVRDIILLMDTDGKIIWSNRAAADVTGRSRESLQGSSLDQILTPSSGDAAERALRGLVDGGRPFIQDLDFIRPDLTAARLEVDFSALPGAGSKTVVAIGRDLSSRRLPGEERSRAEFQALQFQAALVELTRAESDALKDNLAQLTAVAASTLDVARVGIWLFNEDHTEIRCIHLFDRERNVHESGGVLEVGRYPRYFEALEQSRDIAAHDARTDPRTAELVSDYLIEHNIVSMLDVAIRREGRTVGVLCHEYAGVSRYWRLDERNFAGSLADLTALVLETDHRRKAENRLRGSLDQLELFFSQSLDGFFFMMLDEPIRWNDSADKEALLNYVFDHQRMTKVNDAMLSQYRTSRDQLLGHTPRDLFSHDLTHGKDLWRRMLDAGRLHVESDERRADDSRMWVEGDYICFYDSEGRITGHFGIQRDITERKQAEDALRRYNQRVTLLQQMDRAILSANSVKDIVKAALTRVHELVPCKRASVAEFDLRGGNARLVGVYSPANTGLDRGSVVPLDIFGGIEDLRDGKPHIVRDIENAADTPSRTTLRAEGVRSFVNMPLLAEGELIGSLNLGSDAAFSAEHVEIAQEVANSLAVAIRHAQLNEQITRHAAELEQRVAERTAELSNANKSLRDSQERLGGIFRSAMDAIVVIDSSRQIVIFNSAAEKMFRCASSEAVGRAIDTFLSEDLCRLLGSYIAAADATQLWVPDGQRALRRDGEAFPIEATISRTELSDGTLFTIILRDINERKQAEERLEQLSRQNVYLQQEIQSELNFEQIIGASPAMQAVFNTIEMVAGTDSTVLLLGETGTGKELIARAVHNRSRRRRNVMVKVNCGALPATLVETELFGHEKGAFTGALAQKKGRFELADGGTIFLDEVGELTLETQTRLLRVLQEQEFERVGGARTLKVDVRVIAATNRDLHTEVKRGVFRMDLYYRLNVFPIAVPPLRDRKQDIPLMASYFVRKFSERMGRRIHGISDEVCDHMQRYDWPGNVRELANVIERAVILCQESTLRPSHIALAGPPEAGSSEFPTLEEAERDLIRKALERTSGVLGGPKGAAQLLGTNRSTLWSRMRKLGITVSKARQAAAGNDG